MLIRAIAGFLIAGTVAFAARRAHALSLGGVSAAIVVGAMAVAAGWAWGALLIAYFVLSIALSAPLAGPLREMMQSAHRFAAGDLSARTRISRQDEIGELARILDRSADQLQARLNELAGERARTETILSAIDRIRGRLPNVTPRSAASTR